MKEKIITYVLTVVFLMSGTITTIDMVKGQAQTTTNQSGKICSLLLNSPPDKPQTPVGPPKGKPGEDKAYMTLTTDPDGDQIYYCWDWGDNTNSGWEGPYVSGATVTATHFWTAKGTYQIKVKARDKYAESDWSDSLPVTMPTTTIFQVVLNNLQATTSPIN